MRRNPWRRRAAVSVVLVAVLSLVFDASSLLPFLGPGVALAQHRIGGGGGPHFGGGPHPGGPPPGGLRYGGGPPVGPRPTVRPPAPHPVTPGFAPVPGPVPVAPGFAPRPPMPGPVPGVPGYPPHPPTPIPSPVPGYGPGPRPPVPVPGYRPPLPVGPVPVPVPYPRPGWRPPPIAPGPWLWSLPAAALALTIGGITYYNYNSTCYIEQYQGDRVVYVPVQGPCPPPGY